MMPALSPGISRWTYPARAVLALAALGSILAHGCLLAAWLAWGDLPFGRRLLQHWIVAGVLCVVWLVGLVTSVRGRETPQVAFTVAMTVPIISLAAQLPLWIARQLFGWRLVRITGNQSPGRDSPWTIRDLLSATLIVAVSFAIARVSPAAIEAPGFKVVWLIGSAVACIVCAATILPAAIFLLRMQRHARGVKYAWTYAVVAILLEWLVITLVRWQGLTNLPPYFIFIGMSCLIFSYAATTLLAAKAARELGYRLAIS